MKTRRACFLLVLVFILACIYWNIKPNTRRSRPKSKITEDREVDFEVGHQTFSNDSVDKPGSKPHTCGKSSIVPTQVIENMYSLLQQRLFQLELQLNESKLTSKVIFMGPLGVLKEETPLYKASLQTYRHEIEEISDVKGIINTSQWSGLFCYNTENSHGTMTCLSKHEYKRVKLFQKISFFQGLNKLFYPPKNFCYSMKKTKHISALSHSPLSVSCYVILPTSKHKLPKYLLTSNDNGSVHIIQTTKNVFAFTRKKSLLDQRLPDNSILQVINQPFLVEGLPVVIKVYVIITCISPLRIYRHGNGYVLITTSDKESIKESWTLPQFKIYLRKHQSVYNSHSVWDHVDTAIVHTIMVSESLLSSIDLTSSKNGFQVLEFYFTLNSSLYPFLIKVKPPNPGSTLPSVANDIVSILFTMTSSYNHVTKVLYNLADNVGVEGINCFQEKKVCLSNKELIYLIEGHRENISKGGFKKLYPTSDRLRYQRILGELRSSSVGIITYLNTPRLHNVLSLLENYGNQGIDSVVHKNYNKRKEHWYTDNEEESANQKGKFSFRNHLSVLGNCTDDPDTAPVLTDIIVNPEGRLNPAFDKEIKEYKVVYPFSVMVLNLWGKTSSCWSALTVNGNTKSLKGPTNYYLGVGWNEFVIHLLDLSNHPLASYKINVYRKTRNEDHKPFNSRSPHETCTVKQDCDLKIFPNMLCGPSRLSPDSFTKFQLDRKGLPFCKSGYAPGSWVLPCGRCSQPNSCYWNEALWIPALCQHKQLSAVEAKTCLANKKILFVGDSTNRGMMYYLMEKINGSLLQWEKTHSTKVYSSALNGDKTSVSFAYFPQFWLPSNRKPDFLKALHHLMAKFAPLRNNTDTILVVGGVQWLRPSYVTAIKSTLSSVGLDGIKVIIKTLGSGFNLPVPGFVQVDLEGQMKLFRKNKLLVKTSLASGFDVINTYVMTITRYKEFLKGNCGCHFHKVVDLAASHLKEASGDKSDQDYSGNRLAGYHVMGSINNAYSEIMLSRMCS